MLSHRLARPPQRHLASWAPLPRLPPLLELCGQHPVCLLAYIDRTGADFELRGAAGPRDAGRVEGRQRPVHRTASADWSERHFQLRVENTWEHDAGEIAEALGAAYEECGTELVVLVGDPRERPAVRERLPDAVRAVTVETEHGGRAAGSSSPALEEAIEQARHQRTRRRVEEALDRFHAGRVGTDRPTDAVEGVPAVVEAAREHRIDTLLIRPDGFDLGRETWVGAQPDQVAVRRTDAQTLGESDPVTVRADDALLRSAAVTAADVLVVAAADPLGTSDGPAAPRRRGKTPTSRSAVSAPRCAGRTSPPRGDDSRRTVTVTTAPRKKRRCSTMKRGSNPVGRSAQGRRDEARAGGPAAARPGHPRGGGQRPRAARRRRPAC
ncbi:baeRF2 domain-containing protein [Streptomyces sp. NPDC003007]